MDRRKAEGEEVERGDVDGDGDRAEAEKGGADEEEDVLEMD